MTESLKQVFLIGPSPFDEVSKNMGSTNTILLSLDHLPEQERSVVRQHFPAPLPPYHNVSSKERLLVINDIFTGSGFFQNYYSDEYHGFPFRSSGRLIGIIFENGTMVLNNDLYKFSTQRVIEFG